MSGWKKENISDNSSIIKNDENIKWYFLKVGLLKANAITVNIINTSGILTTPKKEIFIGKVINDKQNVQ